VKTSSPRVSLQDFTVGKHIFQRFFRQERTEAGSQPNNEQKTISLYIIIQLRTKMYLDSEVFFTSFT
jgi:hypothetical protein